MRRKEELIEKGYGFYASGALESLTELSYDDIVEGEIGVHRNTEQSYRSDWRAARERRYKRTDDTHQLRWYRSLESHQNSGAVRGPGNAGVPLAAFA